MALPGGADLLPHGGVRQIRGSSALTIRDSFLLTILMFVHPLGAVRSWKLGLGRMDQLTICRVGERNQE